MELDMTKGSPLKLIVKFMIPILLGNLFQQLYSVMDTVIVGRFLGVDALAAVGATGTISFLILGFMQGLTTGFTVLTSQRFGAGDGEGMKKSVGNACLLSIVITLVMTFVSVAGMEWLLHIMQTPDNIYEMSKSYIIIICWGMGFTILYNLCASLLRAVGNSRVPLYFLVISAVLNILLDLAFILVIPMGVAGAALATVISQGVSGLLCLIYIIKKAPALNIEKRHLKPDPWCIRNQLSVGIPMALQFSITAMGIIMVQAALNMLGSTVVAANTVAGKVEQFATLFYQALGAAMATFSAQNRGTGDLDRVKKGAKAAFWMDCAYGILAFAVLQVLLPQLVGLFVTGDIAQVLYYVRIYITISGVFFIPLGMIFIYRNVMQGCGYGFLPMMGGVVELVCRGVLAVAAAKLMSYAGVCWANASAWCVTGFYSWFAYRHVMKKLESKIAAFKN